MENPFPRFYDYYFLGPPDHYGTMSADFAKYHQNETNILLHFITTPIGMIGMLSLLRNFTKSSSMGLSAFSLYLISLLPILPCGTFYGTALLCGLILAGTKYLNLNTVTALIFIFVGYVLQDCAHSFTGEKTYQSAYSNGGHIDLSNPGIWLNNFLEHTFYLLPLCVHIAQLALQDQIPQPIYELLAQKMPSQLQQVHAWAWMLGPLIMFSLGNYCLDSKNVFCFFPGTPYWHRVVRCNITRPTDGRPNQKEDIDIVRSWTMAQNPAPSTSSHWWFKKLEPAPKAAFDRIAHSPEIFAAFRSLFGDKHYAVDVIEGMNEIYVTGPDRLEEKGNNSDQVFYSRHVDGPFGLIPFVSVYRCILGMDKNMMITTHYPLANFSVNACEGDCIGFDFNREIHYITQDLSKRNISDDFRVVLKLHYCVYPRILAPLGWFMTWSNTKYNQLFRWLFLKTINPITLYEKYLAWNVNFHTLVFDFTETFLGQRTLFYLIFVTALWWVTGVYEAFFALTSFVHYFRYITTFYYRKGIDFGSFKRDVLLFKSLALIQLFYHYLFPKTHEFQVDFLSVFMIASGYAVSVMATQALGVDRTYFAAELGLVRPKWITQFPYGYIPHPMIVSQIWALLGFHKASHFREEWPYVVPIHIVLYVIHMLQEQFDIYLKDSSHISDPLRKTSTSSLTSSSSSSSSGVGVSSSATATQEDTDAESEDNDNDVLPASQYSNFAKVKLN